MYMSKVQEHLPGKVNNLSQGQKRQITVLYNIYTSTRALHLKTTQKYTNNKQLCSVTPPSTSKASLRSNKARQAKIEKRKSIDGPDFLSSPKNFKAKCHQMTKNR